MWITMWKPYLPKALDVNNFVENYKNYLQKIFPFVYNLVIHSLLTHYSHMYVDILSGYSVSKD